VARPLVKSANSPQTSTLLWALLLMAERRKKYMISRRSLALYSFCSGATLLNAAKTPPTALLVLAKTDKEGFQGAGRCRWSY
jgi:hypothetical protein